jgi:hypothetical protein
MDSSRRSFFKWLGVGVGAAPAVKAVTTMPDQPTINGQPFAGGALDSVKRASPAWPHWYNVVDGLLYDRIRFAPGQRIPNIVHYFQTPVGQICPYSNVLKTYRHTNMYQYGQLAAPREFFAQRVLFAVHPSLNETDFEVLSAASVWEFQLMNKIYARAPMLMHGPARAGLRDVVGFFGKDDKASKAVEPLADEVVNAAHHSPLTGGMLIPTLAYFDFLLYTEDDGVTLLPAKAGGKGLDLLIAFQGADARGVQ